jgi:hypothetical protein
MESKEPDPYISSFSRNCSATPWQWIFAKAHRPGKLLKCRRNPRTVLHWRPLGGGSSHLKATIYRHAF